MRAIARRKKKLRQICEQFRRWWREDGYTIGEGRRIDRYILQRRLVDQLSYDELKAVDSLELPRDWSHRVSKNHRTGITFYWRTGRTGKATGQTWRHPNSDRVAPRLRVLLDSSSPALFDVIRERVRLIDAHRSPAAILARKLAKRASPALVDAVLRVHLPTIAEFDPVGNCRLASTCRGRLAALADGAVLDALAFAFPALASPAVSRRIALAPLPGLEVLILTRPESRNVPTACLDARAYHVVFHARLLDGRRIIARRWFTWANEEDNDGALTCAFDLADIGTLVDSNSVGLAGIENQCVGVASRVDQPTRSLDAATRPVFIYHRQLR